MTESVTEERHHTAAIPWSFVPVQSNDDSRFKTAEVAREDAGDNSYLEQTIPVEN